MRACVVYWQGNTKGRLAFAFPFFLIFKNNIADFIQVLIKPIINWRAVPGGTRKEIDHPNTATVIDSSLPISRQQSRLFRSVLVSRLARMLIFHRETPSSRKPIPREINEATALRNNNGEQIRCLSEIHFLFLSTAFVPWHSSRCRYYANYLSRVNFEKLMALSRGNVSRVNFKETCR